MKNFLSFLLLALCASPSIAMFRAVAIRNVQQRNRIPLRGFSSQKKAQDIEFFVTLARCAAERDDWAGVHGEASRFAHNHFSLAQLETNKKIMVSVKHRLDQQTEQLITDASILHLGIQAIDLQISLRKSGAHVITFADLSACLKK